MQGAYPGESAPALRLLRAAEGGALAAPPGAAVAKGGGGEAAASPRSDDGGEAAAPPNRQQRHKERRANRRLQGGSWKGGMDGRGYSGQQQQRGGGAAAEPGAAGAAALPRGPPAAAGGVEFVAGAGGGSDGDMAAEERRQADEEVRRLLAPPAAQAESAAAAGGDAACPAADLSAAAPRSPDHRGRGGDGGGGGGGGWISGGRAYFPVMTPAEVAEVSVPATAPAAEVLRVLDARGVCLVTGLLSAAEIAAMERLWGRDLLQIVDEPRAAAPRLAGAVRRVRAEGPAAWPPASDAGLGGKFASLRGAPHGAFAWAARLHPKVRGVFAGLFGVPPAELATGVDNLFWAGPHARAAEDNKEWLHCDQNHRTGMTWRAVQGLLYIWPSVTERCSTTVVWPGSHLPAVYAEVMADPWAEERGRKSGGHLIQLNALWDEARRGRLLREAAAGARRMPCPAGSLLLWDSRTIHQGWSGGPRLAQPVCWEPRERRDAAALRRKLWMAATGCPSSHSSSEGRVHALGPRVEPKPHRPAPRLPQQQEEEGEDGGAAGDGEVRLPLRDMMVPYGVAPGREAAWRALLPALWRDGRAARCADHADAAAISALLRDDVRAAL